MATKDGMAWDGDVGGEEGREKQTFQVFDLAKLLFTLPLQLLHFFFEFLDLLLKCLHLTLRLLV